MGFGSFFKELSGDTNNSAGNNSMYKLRTVHLGDDSYTPIEANGEIMHTAMQIGVDYIAAAVSKCEIRTFINNTEVRGNDWYLWNIKPNKNQSSTQFWTEFIHRLYFNREVLVIPINKQLIIADGFSKEVRALEATKFTGITRDGCSINRTYTTETAIYMSLDNNTCTGSLLSSVGLVMDELLKITCTHYYKEGGEHGVLYYDTAQIGTEDENNEFEQLLNEDFKKYFDSKNAVLPLYNGMKYESKFSGSSQRSSYITDVSTIIKEGFTRMAQALRVPPALMLGEAVDVGNVVKDFLTFCIDPLMDGITEAANAVMYGKGVIEGNYLQADSSCIEHMDIFSSGGNIDKIHSNSILSVNEIRRKVGEPRINEGWADSYIQTKNYDSVETKGGSDDDESENDVSNGKG